MSEYIVRETGSPGRVTQEIVGELVRCEYCVHFGGGCWCKWYEHGTDVNGYCHHGDRKDDE